VALRPHLSMGLPLSDPIQLKGLLFSDYIITNLPAFVKGKTGIHGNYTWIMREFAMQNHGWRLQGRIIGAFQSPKLVVLG
jgi:hypothetical protein